MIAQKMLREIAGKIDPLDAYGAYLQDDSVASTITGATSASPIVVTSANHGLIDGDRVHIKSVLGNTAANNTPSNPYWTVTRVDANNVSLNGSTWVSGAYTSGGSMTKTLVGAVPGKKFAAQDLLDVYNEARFLAMEALMQVMSPAELALEVNENVIIKTDLAFASGVADQPDGYIQAISLSDASGAKIYIKDPRYYQVIKGGTLPSYVESSTNRFVIEKGTTFTAISGTTYVPNAGTYILVYFGITPFTLAQIVAGVVEEPFLETRHSLLQELAIGIANQYGRQKTLDLARRIIESKA